MENVLSNSAESDLILAIDTSGARASVALGDRHSLKVLSQCEGNDAQSHSEELDGLVRSLLQQHTSRKHKLRAILLGEGPGSFTGLRIGFAYAQGLALGLEIPIIPIPSALGVSRDLSFTRFPSQIVAPAGKDLIFLSRQEGPIFESQWRMRSSVEPSSTLSALLVVSLPEAVSSQIMSSNDVMALSPVPQFPHLVVASKVATGLLSRYFALAPNIVKAIPQHLGAQQLANLEPRYVRSVAAKSIAERVSKPS